MIKKKDLIIKDYFDFDQIDKYIIKKLTFEYIFILNSGLVS